MEVKYKIILDFARPNKTKTIEIMQNDVRSRKLQLVLMNNGRAIDGTELDRVIIKAYKPDETIIFAEANIVQKNGVNTNVVEFTLPADAARIVGKSIYAAVIYETTLAQITSPEWYVNVTKQLYDEEDYVSSNELSGFMSYVADALNAKESAERDAATCTAAITGSQAAQAASETAQAAAEAAQAAAEAAQASAQEWAEEAARTVQTAGVSSFNGRSGAVVPASGDYNANQIMYQSSTVGAFLTNLGSRQQLLLAAHPVGSIYMSTEETSPATLFGGAWAQLSGRFLIGAGDEYQAGILGGSTGHTHASCSTSSVELHGTTSGVTGGSNVSTGASEELTTGAWNGSTGSYSGSTGSTAITAAQMPSHSHGIAMIQCGSEARGYGLANNTGFQNRVLVAHSQTKSSTAKTGSGNGHTHTMAHSHSIPAHTHVVPAHVHSLNSHQHDASNLTVNIPEHDHLVPEQTGSNMPPYQVVYMWIRTA